VSLVGALDFSKGDGLVPAIVQDADDGRVLMLGYMNQAAVEATEARRRVVFFSRSRQALWEKGETSGNTLDLVALRFDCDADALLALVRPRGPVCHTGTVSCFDGPPDALDGAVSGGFLGQLEAIIGARANAPASSSYTAGLLARGLPRVAQKVGEEGVEVALAAVTADDDALVGEAADLVFHLLVLLRARGLPFARVVKELVRRHEAAARPARPPEGS
jgi:phosphoribosyl-AMP cyclohydrolase / phosphoribosyl-ATP pyrophosphohydrolase